jgi:hypothetical protein
MRPNRQRFLHQFAALGALLRREARIDSDHLTASTCSLAAQDRQKRAPRGIKNALCQSTARQTTKVQMLDHDRLVRIRVLLPQLDAVPGSAALEPREAPFLISMGKERFHCFGKPLGKALDGRGRNVCAPTPLEQRSQVVLAQKLAGLLIVRAFALQHFVVQLARFIQARIQTAALFSVWVQAKLIRSHTFSYIRLKSRLQHVFWAKAAGYPLGAGALHPSVNALGFRA